MGGDDRRPGFFFRWTRRLLVALGVLTVLVFGITSSGLYGWFNVTPEDRVRIEYGNIWWRHVQGGTARQDTGVDAGASKIRWRFERKHLGDGRTWTYIPLWMPALFFFGTATAMTFWRWRHVNAA